jgi:hypothetical protein
MMKFFRPVRVKIRFKSRFSARICRSNIDDFVDEGVVDDVFSIDKGLKPFGCVALLSYNVSCTFECVFNENLYIEALQAFNKRGNLVIAEFFSSEGKC